MIIGNNFGVLEFAIVSSVALTLLFLGLLAKKSIKGIEEIIKKGKK